jgi:hypothetical protein
MSITMIGLDTAKSVFQVHAVNEAGEVVVRRKLQRSELIAFFEKQASCTVVMGHYRILILDHLGQVASSSACNVTTDNAALVAASWWAGMQRGVEVWKGPRLVGALAAQPASGSS